MKVRNIAFSISSPGLSIEDIRDAFESAHKTSTTNSDAIIDILFESGDKWHRGMVLTRKNQRKFCEAEKSEGGDITFHVRDVSNNAHIAEFNHFIIHSETGRGLYQYYRGSCSLNRFSILASGIHNKHRNALRAKAEKSISEDSVGRKTARKKDVQRRLGQGCKVKISLLAESRKFHALLEEASDLKRVEYELHMLQPTSPGALHSDLVNRTIYTAHLNTSGMATAILRAKRTVRDWFKQNKEDISAARVLIKNSVGETDWIDAMENVATMGVKREFDELADDLPVSSRDFSNGKITRLMIACAEETDALFSFKEAESKKS